MMHDERSTIMKSLIMIAMMAAVTFAFVGCKKEKTLSEKMGDAAKSAEKAVDAAAKDGDKAAGDLNKKLDGALQK